MQKSKAVFICLNRLFKFLTLAEFFNKAYKLY